MRMPHLEKFNKITFLLFIIGIGVGLLITTQWRTKPARIANPLSPYLSLRDTRENLINEQKDLKTQLKTLQAKIDEEQQKLKKYHSSREQVEEVEKDRALVGLTEIKKEGVIITMDDSKSGPVTIDSITHAADLRDLVNFLWAAGAEAISINGERIVFTTSIDCIINTILINSTKTTPPFVVQAVGEEKRLMEKLNDENSLKDIRQRVKEEGLVFDIRGEKEITIPVYEGSYTIEYAKIIN